MSDIVSRDVLLSLVDGWLGRGGQVVGPARQRSGSVRFVRLENSGQLLLNGFVHPANTAKECVLPKTERLYGYRRRGTDVSLVDDGAEPVPLLLVGCRPCDAAAFPIVDKVMRWDCLDSQYTRRRAAMTVLTLACASWDDHCFCTGVGLGPAAERGSDVLLLDAGDGLYEARKLTDPGREVMAGRTRPGERAVQPPTGPERRVDTEHALRVLADGFDSPLWEAEGLRCTGCGICAYTCPTCHCFDIVDEAHGNDGCRRRNWDSCQFRTFTVHASGHNPRPDQPSRQRQRNMHKFVTYPDKFGDVLCTGCGNCSRNCPVGLGVLHVLGAAQAQPADGPELARAEG